MNAVLERVPTIFERDSVSLATPDSLDRLFGLLERARSEQAARMYPRQDRKAPYRALMAAVEAADDEAA